MGDTGIVRKAKGESNVPFLSPDALRLGQISSLKLIPSGSSPEVLSTSRPRSPEGSSVSDSSLVAHRAAKSRMHLLGLSKSRDISDDHRVPQ